MSGHPSGESRPILVTGSHRSGTTWVGRTLAMNQSVGYVHEPFRPDFPRGISNGAVDRWFYYVCAQNEREFLPWIDRVIQFEYDLLSGLRFSRTPKDIARVLRDALLFWRYR